MARNFVRTRTNRAAPRGACADRTVSTSSGAFARISMPITETTAVELNRREVLAGAALLAAGCGGAKEMPPRSGWDAVKAQFALGPGRHFDAFLFAAHPKPVRDAIEHHRAALDAGAAQYLHEHEIEFDKRVADAAARYLGVRAQRDGVKVRKVALYDDPARATAGEMLRRLRDAIGPRTRVLALTWVHSGTG